MFLLNPRVFFDADSKFEVPFSPLVFELHIGKITKNGGKT